MTAKEHDFKGALESMLAMRDSTALTPNVNEIYKEFYWHCEDFLDVLGGRPE